MVKYFIDVSKFRKREKCLFLNLVSFVFILLVSFEFGDAQTFTRSCQDPLIQEHLQTFEHSYCYHACGYDLGVINPTNVMSICTTNGNCICNHPCGTLPPSNQFGDICPPFLPDPADPNQNAEVECTQACNLECSGGQGQICGEVEPLGPNNDIFAKICTCYCPPQTCIVNVSPFIVFIAKPITPIIIKHKIFVWKSIFKKLFTFCKVLFKLCWLYLLKVFLWCLYYYIFNQWLNTSFERIIATYFRTFDILGFTNDFGGLI